MIIVPKKYERKVHAFNAYKNEIGGYNNIMNVVNSVEHNNTMVLPNNVAKIGLIKIRPKNKDNGYRTVALYVISKVNGYRMIIDSLNNLYEVSQSKNNVLKNCISALDIDASAFDTKIDWIMPNNRKFKNRMAIVDRPIAKRSEYC